MTMTGKDLIIYILENNLVDKPVYEDGKLLGFMTAAEAAIKFDVGLATIEILVSLGMLKGIQIGNELFIPANAEYPRKGGPNV